MTVSRRDQNDRGSALVELALALPILILVMIITVDFSRVFYTAMSLTSAARAGAQYGAYNASQSSDTAGMQTTAVNATNTTGITAAAARFCQCADNAGTFSTTSGGANNCVAAEATACPSGHRVMTVTVTTSKVFSTVFANWPGIPHLTTLIRSATLRVWQLP